MPREARSAAAVSNSKAKKFVGMSAGKLIFCLGSGWYSNRGSRHLLSSHRRAIYAGGGRGYRLFPWGAEFSSASKKFGGGDLASPKRHSVTARTL